MAEILQLVDGLSLVIPSLTSPKTNMTMEKQPFESFEDVYRIRNCDFHVPC